jgi:hypothetical protein
MRRLLSGLRQFHSDRWLRAEILREGFDQSYIRIADAHRVIKGLADDERLKSRLFTAPNRSGTGLPACRAASHANNSTNR